MGDMADKAKSFLKKFSSPFGSSRKFKGHGHRLGTNEPATSAQPVAEVAALKISSDRSRDDKQQWMRQENEQKLQQGNWKKLQQEKWAKERNIPAQIPPVASASSATPNRDTRTSSRDRDRPFSAGNPSQGAAGRSSNQNQAPLPSTGPEVVSGEDSSDMDRLVRAVEAREELAVALGTFLSAEPSSAALDVLLRLLRNIVKEPKLEKFRKIRMGNPKIKETIGTASELLEGLGFYFVEEGGESWAIMDEPVGDTITVLRGVIALVESQVVDTSDPVTLPPPSAESATVDAVAPAIDRQLRVFSPSSDISAATIQLPESFYELSAAEIKSEAARRGKKLEESEMLIPKSYREKQAAAARRKYKFSVIRVQFPDGMIIQGVFLPREPTTALYEFVESTLANGGLEFELCHPLATRNSIIPNLPLLNGKCPTLEEADLVPTALLKFKPLQSETAGYCGLHPEYTAKSEPLTAVPF
ncbi:hypothetical protein O6H91_17G033800 [Diphasiastrum complanatum]|uniref:Uncharacterized protein n=1 Tax=Diphasiastrum complanatum TaxID=34168 RepID=A0ACC2B5H9_DIPCM|nr:hypothetical protein O6H91_17G033800 [Diphasiastrum complanatum]